jgi:hypothetical protein
LPFAWRERGRLGIFGLKKGEGKGGYADGEVTVPMGLFIAQSEEDKSVAVRRYGFCPWI